MYIECNGLPVAWLISHMRNTFYITCIHPWGLFGRSCVRSIAFLWVLFDKSCFRAIDFLWWLFDNSCVRPITFLWGYLTNAVFGQSVFYNRRNLAFSHSHFRILNWFAVSHSPFFVVGCVSWLLYVYIGVIVCLIIVVIGWTCWLFGWCRFLVFPKQTTRSPTPTVVLTSFDLMP